MSRFWKWLAARKFMQDTTPAPPQQTCEEQLALAVLRFAEERNIAASGGIYESGVRGCNAATGVTVAAHYEVYACYEPEACFGLVVPEGVSVQ